jgi:hypothetical protein
VPGVLLAGGVAVAGAPHAVGSLLNAGHVFSLENLRWLWSEGRTRL